MRAVYRGIYVLIGLWFLRRLRAKLTCLSGVVRVSVNECKSNEYEKGRTGFTVVHRDGHGNWWFWFQMDCDRQVANDILTEFIRRWPELDGNVALHTGCRCEFESIRGVFGYDKGTQIIDDMYNISQDYRKKHPGKDIGQLPGD